MITTNEYLKMLKRLNIIDENGRYIKGIYAGMTPDEAREYEDNLVENHQCFGYKRDVKKFATKFNLTIKEITNCAGCYTAYFEESFTRKEFGKMYDEYMKETYDWYGKN